MRSRGSFLLCWMRSTRCLLLLSFTSWASSIADFRPLSYTCLFQKIHFSRQHTENLKLWEGISISRISWAGLPFIFFSREEDTNTQEWRKSTTQKSQKRRRSFMQRRRRYEWTAQTSISSGTINSLTFHIKKRIFHSFSQKSRETRSIQLQNTANSVFKHDMWGARGVWRRCVWWGLCFIIKLTG